MQINTLNYVHSRGIVIRDIRPTHMAVGNSEDSLNKIFIFDYASAIQISDTYTPRDDFILFGLILLELNSVEYPQFEPTVARDAEIIDAEWHENYIRVKCIIVR